MRDKREREDKTWEKPIGTQLRHLTEGLAIALVDVTMATLRLTGVLQIHRRVT